MKTLLALFLLAAPVFAQLQGVNYNTGGGGGSGSSSGLSSVTTDASLTGSGTAASPLKLAGAVTCTTCTVTGNAFSVGGSSFSVGGGSATVAYQMSAGSYIGNGAALTGIPSTSSIVGVYVQKAGDQMSGPLFINGSTLTVGGNAFSVGASTFAVVGGSVGFRTSAPAYAVDVQGAGNISQQLIVGGTVTARGTLLLHGDSINGAGDAARAIITNTAGGTWTIGEVQNALVFDIVRGGGQTIPISVLRGFVNDNYTKTAFGSCSATQMTSGPGVEICQAKGQHLIKISSNNATSLFDIMSNGNMVVLASATFRDAAFSIGGSTLDVNGGNVGIGVAAPVTASTYSLTASSGSYFVNGGVRAQFFQLNSGAILGAGGGTVSTDASLTGDGSGGSPLKLAGNVTVTSTLTVVGGSGAGLYSVSSASGVFVASGPVRLGASAYFAYGDGTTSTTAARRPPTYQFLTSGTGATYTTPIGAIQLIVECWGGGGGGGAANTNNGVNGSTTSFNSVEANPGNGGLNGSGAAQGGQGGTGGGGTASFRIPGNPGNGLGSSMGGNGGIAPGLGGAGIGYQSAAGLAAAANSGSGGGGGTAAGGGSGEYFKLIINNPAATYTYTIGPGGAGGAAGGNAGGAGGSGKCDVEERYN